MGEAAQTPPVEVQLTDIVTRPSTELLLLRLALAEFLFAVVLIVYFFIIRFIFVSLPAAYAIDITFVFIIFFDIILRSTVILITLGQWINQSVIIRRDRITFSRGVFFPSTTDLNFGLITGVDVRQSFFGKTFNYGTLVLTISGRPPVEIPDIPDPFRYEKILEGILPFKERLEITLKQGGPQAQEEEQKRGPFKETSEGMTSKKK